MKSLRCRKICWEGRRALLDPPAWRSFIKQGRALLPDSALPWQGREGKSSVQSHLGVLGKSSHLLPCLESCPRLLLPEGMAWSPQCFTSLCPLSSEFPAWKAQSGNFGTAALQVPLCCSAKLILEITWVQVKVPGGCCWV